METKICKWCPENGEQPIARFGEYKIKGRSQTNRRNKCHSCRRKDEAKRYESDPLVREKANLAARTSLYKRVYGLSIEDFKLLKIKQNNQCKICNKEMVKPNVDHCHETGKIRGLLCWNCNVGLGYFKDSINNLSNAIKYLGG